MGKYSDKTQGKDSGMMSPRSVGRRPINLYARRLQMIYDNQPLLTKRRAEYNSLPNRAPSRLPGNVQAKMEQSFNTDFSDVSIHQNSEHAASRNALAYTQGNDIHFAPGQYEPESRRGQELIAHELSHVVQQRQGRAHASKQGSETFINDNPALEKEADLMSKRAATGEKVDADITPISETIQKKGILGEIGLNDGTVTRTDGKVTVGGKNAEGESIRPVTYEDEAAYIRSEQHINEFRTNAATHAFFEFVAHFLAYQKHDYEPPPSINKTIEENGYRFEEIDEGHLGFQYVILRSRVSGQNDIIAFRGTSPGFRPSDLATIYTDTNPKAVGFHQYLANRSRITKILEGARGKFDIAGHSLGGSLAQIVAAYHTSHIANVYTFQAPGIDDKIVERFRSAQDKPNVYHHVAVGDMVDKAGEENLPGHVYVHDFGIFWIKTQDLLISCGKKIVTISQSMRGVNAENRSITFNVVKGILQSGIPVVGKELLRDKIRKVQKDIDDLEAHIRNIKKEARELKELVEKVIAGIGEAHLKFLFSSENFGDARQKAHIDDSFYTNKNETIGAGQDRINESSVITAHNSYVFQDERKTAETARDIVGHTVNQVIDPKVIFLAYRTIDTVVSVVEAIEKAVDELFTLLTSLAQSVTDAASSAATALERLIQQKTDEIGRWVDQFNSIDFWINLQRM